MGRGYDALEAAKQKAGTARQSRVPRVSVSQPAPVEVPKEAQTTPAPALVIEVQTKRFRVRVSRQVSLLGRLVFFPAGKILRADHYGERALQLLRDQLDLEELTEGG